MNKILVTPRSLTRDGHPALERLAGAGYEVRCCRPASTPSEAELIELVPDCVGWIAGVEPVSAKVIQAAGRLKAISRNGTGVDNLPLAALQARGIALARAEGANARGVAELAVALMLGGLRHVDTINQGLKAGQWPRPVGREIENRTVAVVGYGHIGMEFAKMACGLGARVRVHDPYLARPIRPIGDFGWARDRAGLFAGADVVSLHCPAQPDASPVLDRAALAALAPGAVVVNTARASLVDEQALLEGLESGRIAAYATDVFHQEPPAPSALLRHPRVIATSHIGGLTEESIGRATEAAVDNLLRLLEREHALSA